MFQKLIWLNYIDQNINSDLYLSITLTGKCKNTVISSYEVAIVTANIGETQLIPQYYNK